MAKTFIQRKRIDPRPFGAQLLKVRKHFGLTQEKMAQHMEISRTAYRNNEKGVHLLELSSAVHLRNKLGVSLEWLVSDTGPMLMPKGADAKAVLALGADVEANGMIKLMGRIPFVRNAVIAFYQKFLVENDGVIRKSLENQSAGKGLLL